MESDALLTRREVCERLKISTTTLWEVTGRGSLPAVRLGRAVRYRPEDVQRFIEEHRDASRGN
jgi:excisionase family DNA binding protein